MRLATINPGDGPRSALQQDDHFIDLHATDHGLPQSLRRLLALGPVALQAVRQAAARSDAVRYPRDRVRLLPPIPDPPKIICLGLNYRDHALETGARIPQEPILFSKFATSLIGDGAPIILPAVSQEVDYEAELVVVIGRRGRHVPEDRAVELVAGYTIGHDVSARDWQLHKEGKQWVAGKSFDTFAPTGPVLVTADDVPNPHELDIRLRLNGQVMQDSNTRQMIFTVPPTLAYLSRIFTLEPGDLVFTGTPPGVGFARRPPVYLRDGDVVEIEIQKLGVLRNPVVQEQLPEAS